MPEVAQGLSSTDALVTLLTLEGLLFAALSIIFGLGERAPVARRIPFNLRPYQLGYVAAWALTAVAVGAVAAWLPLFTSPWRWKTELVIQAVAILIGIATPPVFAFLVAYGLKPKESGAATAHGRS